MGMLMDGPLADPGFIDVNQRPEGWQGPFDPRSPSFNNGNDPGFSYDYYKTLNQLNRPLTPDEQRVVDYWQGKISSETQLSEEKLGGPRASIPDSSVTATGTTVMKSPYLKWGVLALFAIVVATVVWKRGLLK